MKYVAKEEYRLRYQQIHFIARNILQCLNDVWLILRLAETCKHTI